MNKIKMNPKYIYTSFIKKINCCEGIDPEKFILEVKKHECLWNVRSKHYNMKCYGNREIKRQAWEDIGRAFHANWDSFSSTERQKKVDSMTRKWTNLRKYYTEGRRRPSDEGPSKKKQKRRYHDLLTFLDDSLNRKRTTRINEFKEMPQKPTTASNDSSSDSESHELCIVEDENELAMLSKNCDKDEQINVEPKSEEKNETKNETKNEWETWDTPLDLATRSSENKHVCTQTIEQNSVITRLHNEEPRAFTTSPCHQRVNNPVGIAPPASNLSSHGTISTLDLNSDACKKFLLSLLPEIMSLNVRQNMQFRLGIMDLLNDIKYRINDNY